MPDNGPCIHTDMHVRTLDGDAWRCECIKCDWIWREPLTGEDMPLVEGLRGNPPVRTQGSQ
jgi:hypothetical protein